MSVFLSPLGNLPVIATVQGILHVCLIWMYMYIQYKLCSKSPQSLNDEERVGNSENRIFLLQHTSRKSPVLNEK